MKNLLKKVNLFYKIATDINQLSKKEIRNLLDDPNTDLSEVINSIDDNTSKWVLYSIYENNQYNDLRKLIIEKAIKTDNGQVLSDVAKYGGVEDLRLIVKNIDSDYILSIVANNRNADIDILNEVLNKINLPKDSPLYLDIVKTIHKLKEYEKLNNDRFEKYQKMDEEASSILGNLGYEVL